MSDTAPAPAPAPVPAPADKACCQNGSCAGGSRSLFLRVFAPGLVLGLVIDLFGGAYLMPLLEPYLDRETPLPTAKTSTKAPSGPRDPQPAPRQPDAPPEQPAAPESPKEAPKDAPKQP